MENGIHPPTRTIVPPADAGLAGGLLTRNHTNSPPEKMATSEKRRLFQRVRELINRTALESHLEEGF